MRKLASIQIISNIVPIPDADNIELATVMGWNVVVGKNEFKIKDRCVFFEIDSVLPEASWSEFLRRKKFRVKTCKLRGALSQGLALPLSILGGPDPTRGILSRLFRKDGWKVGKDVTEFLKVRKFSICEAKKGRYGFKIGKAKGNFPSFIPKTDEIRLQSSLKFLKKIEGNPIYVTTKCDGTSGTFFKKDGEFFSCSRNRIVEEGDNVYWEAATRYNLKEKIPEYVAVQGEVCGKGIQKNRLNVEEIDLFVFNVFDIKTGKYYSYDRLVEFCNNHKLKMVPLDFESDGDFDNKLETWIERAKGKYEGTKNNREGIVVRTKDQIVSFKVLNNDYLLKEEE